jgi:D-glycero-alpha-D-manno-heptose 1-phosphate guanylyltransferase
MEAIVLAGGFGTRLREVVPDLPKPMAPIAGRPFLEILLESLARKGFKRVILSLGFMSEKISGFFGPRFAAIDLIYVVEDQPLGTGGAARLALEQAKADHVFVFNGDTFLDLEVDQVESQWITHHKPIMIAREVADTSRFGRLACEDGLVTGFLEKGMSGPGLINAGCYVFRRDQLADFELGMSFSLEQDYLARKVGTREFDVFVSHGRFIDIGIPEDYERAQRELVVSDS